MKNRTAIVILLVAAGLVAFIFLFERDSMTTAEREGRQGRVFVDFQRDAVTALAVRGTGGERVALERRGAPGDDPAAEERWVITGGERELPADAGAVRQILSAIDFVLEDRVVREPGAAKDPSFGLDRPRVEISFTSRGRTTSFRAGADAPGEKLYLAVEGREEVLVVEHHFLEEIDRSRGELRDKRLVERPLSKALAVTVGGGEAALVLARDGEQAPWRVALSGAEVLAAADRAGNLLRELGKLEAARFVADGVEAAGLGQYGLEPPSRVVGISLGGEERVEIRLGSACADGEGLVHATVAGTGTVACVDRAILGELDGVERFRELRLAPLREEDVIRVRLVRGGAELSLEREEGAGPWKVTGAGDAPEIDGEAVAGLIGRLSAARASSLVPGAEAVAGLGEPAARVVFELAGDQPPVELLFHPRPEPELVAVRRGTEAAVLTADAALLEAVRPDLLAFRARAVAVGEVEDATRLEIDGPVAFTLGKKDDGWAITAPVELAADGTAARQLVKRAARIEVERFAAAKAGPEHGLERPFARVIATFAEEKAGADGREASDRTGERRVEIGIGAEAGDGSRFARVAGGDGAVFVLGRSWIDDLAKPPVARDLVQFEGGSVMKATWTYAGATADAAREGEAWASTAPGFDRAAFGRAFTDLAAVRTTRAAALGKDKAAAAVPEPRLTLDLSLQDGEKAGAVPIRLHFGGASDDPAESGVLVRREGVDAAFIVPARVLDDLLAALGLAAPVTPPSPVE